MKSMSRVLSAIALSLLVAAGAALADPTVVRLVGAGPTGWDNGLWGGDGQAAPTAYLNAPTGVASSSTGNLLIADYWNNRIRSIDNTGNINTIVGDGWPGNVSDGTALGTSIWGPWGVAAKGTTVIFTDTFNSAIRAVSATGVLTQIAGTYGVTNDAGFGAFHYSIANFNGDNQPASTANLNWPLGVCTDTAGNIYVADSWNQRIRKIDTARTITTVAGNGWADSWGRGRFSGDGGLATSACLFWPSAVAVDTSGNLYIADTGNQRIRRVDAGTHVISTVAGNGRVGGDGDEGLATAASLNSPMGLAISSTGIVYIADTMNNRVRSVTLDGSIHAVAGTGFPGNTGDSGPALSATFQRPMGLTVTAGDDLIIADTENNAVRMLLFKPTGRITGVVRDASTNSPLPGATVAWNNIMCTADANGAYAIVAYGGTQPLTAHLATYGTVTDTLTVVEGSTQTHDFYLPSGFVQGVVVDDVGTPVSGATVTAADNTAITSDTGTFSMRLGPGAQSVSAAKEGYQSSGPAQITITTGDTVTVQLVISLLKSVPIALSYTNDWISWDTAPGDYDTGTFDTAFPAEQLPASNAIFSLPRAGSNIDFLFPDKTDGARNCVSAAGQTITIPAGFYSELHFLEAAHNGATTAPITLNYGDGTKTTTSLTWNDWCWNSVGAQLGANESVAISADHRHSTTDANDSPAVDILHLELPVDSSKSLTSVTLGAPTKGGLNMVFAMSLDTVQSAFGTVQGVVRDAATSAPIAGATVSFSGRVTTTDANGAYTLPVLGGTQQIVAKAPSYNVVSASVAVTAAQTVRHDFLLTSASVAGTVIDDAGHVVGGAKVTAGTGATATTATDGTFSMKLPAGTQTLTASKTGYTSSAATAVTVATGQTTNVTLTITRPTGPVSYYEIPLTSSYNYDWISYDTNPGDFTTDTTDYCFPAEQLPTSNALTTVPTPTGTEPFMFPNKLDGQNNVVFANAQTFTVPTNRYSTLHMLEASLRGAFTGSVQLNYSDGSSASTSLTFTDWASTSWSANENVGIQCTHRHKSGQTSASPAVAVFQSQMTVNTSKKLVSITLPANASTTNNRAFIFAMTMDIPASILQYGDVNGDGAINTLDAASALRCAAGISTLAADQANRADVMPLRSDGSFGDGQVTIADAVAILIAAQHQ
jgi:hypothetical protein